MGLPFFVSFRFLIQGPSILRQPLSITLYSLIKFPLFLMKGSVLEECLYLTKHTNFMLMTLNDSSIKVDPINGFSHQHLFKTQPNEKTKFKRH